METNMKKLVLALLLPLTLTNFAWGQDAPRADLAITMNLHEVDAGSSSLVPQRFPGFGVNLGLNLNEKFGVALDFEWVTASRSPNDFTILTAMAGPRFTKRTERVTSFAHAMGGLYRLSSEDVSGGSDISQTGLGLAFGGGWDINANKRVAIRVLQFDYVPNRISGQWFNDYRLLFGVTLKLGSQYE